VLKSVAPPKSASRPSSGYLPQLDGLRGLAIIAVALHHFGFHPPSWIDWGPVGPSVFFMLSGYLITLSLWKLEATYQAKQISFWRLLAGFHARRIFRLLPILIILILIGSFTDLPEYRETWAWSLTFTTNLLLVLHNDWIGGISHFWSLSMQEQFYFLWPVVLLVPRAFFPQAMVAAIALAAGFRLTCIEVGAPEFARWFLLPGSLDAFATGGLGVACPEPQNGNHPFPDMGDSIFLRGPWRVGIFQISAVPAGHPSWNGGGRDLRVRIFCMAAHLFGGSSRKPCVEGTEIPAAGLCGDGELRDFCFPHVGWNFALRFPKIRQLC
jgi:hypothetical protein